MKRMTIQQKIEALNNGMNTYKFNKKYFAKPDEIDGKRFAITSKRENGTFSKMS